MAPFDRIQDSDGRVLVDWHLMQNGPITLFRDRPEFDFAASWLKTRNYDVHTIEAADVASFVAQMNNALQFPLRFGHEWNGNLDALNDGVGDITFDDKSGVAFAFVHYDRLASADYRFAHATLDIIAWNSRFHLLFGHRLMAFVYTEDAQLRFTALGAQDALWNNIRWAHSETES